MELHHQKQLTPIQSTKFKSRTKVSGGGNKFVGVRQRPSGRWVAEIKDTTQKIRVWLGTFETADEAARAYDEAACLLRGANTRTNFTATRRPASGAGAGESPLATRIRKLLHHKKLSSDPSLLTPHQNPDFPPSRRKNPAFSPPAATSPTSAGGGSPTSSTSTSTAADSGGIFGDEFELGPSMAEASWAFDAMFDCFSEIGGGAAAAVAEATEFERMKVERQISASLYAMNGVQEYFEAVQDLSSSFPASSLLDPLWDLPQLLHFYEN